MYLCVDIGGTKTLVALVNGRGRILKSVRFATAHDQGQFLTTLVQEIRANLPLTEVRMVSVAMPGTVKNNKAPKLGNLPWKDFDIARDLGEEFGLPVVVGNDANLAGLAEGAKFKGLTLYLTFSTGVGGSVMKNGQLDETRQNYEPGHKEYEWGGKRMEWEDFASAKAVVERFGKLTSEIRARKDWKEVAARISVGLGPEIIELRPDRVVFGGPLGRALFRYRRYLKKELRERLPSEVKLPRLRRAKFDGGESVIYGCFMYARDQITDK